MEKSIRRDLSVRIGLVILAIGIVIGVVYYAYSISYQKKEFKNYIEHQTKQISDTFALQLWLFDLNTTRKLGKMFVDFPEVSGLRLLDHNRKVIFEKDSPVKDGAVHVHRKLLHEGEKLVGYVDIHYSNTAWQHHMKNELFAGALLMLGVILGSFMVINLLLGRYLARPLEDLQKDMATLARGDFRKSRLIGQKTEIQSIIDAFNSLVVQLQARDDELKNADKKLRQSEKKFREMANLLPQVVYETDIEGDLTFVNEAAFKLFDITQEDVEKGFNFLQPLLPKDRARAKENINEILNGKSFVNVEYSAVGKDGAPISVLTYTSPIKKDDIIVGLRGIVVDISEHKRLEEELLKVRKLESVGVLAGGIAHDFNNILAAILGNLSLALMTIEPGNELYELLLESEKASFRAKDLTQQLLTFAKGGEPVKKIALIDDVIKDSAGFVLRGSNVCCEFNFGKELRSVVIDTGQISQVIQNIVVNAGQAMPDGGTISIDCLNFFSEPGDLIPLRPGNYVKITIKDQGSGIPAAMLDNIFDPYFTTKHTGSGLGLAITHSIISKHDGYITVESEPDKGATFTLYLPASQEVPESVPEPEVVVTGPVKGHGRIMIMDDEKGIRSLVERALSRSGYEVVSAADGKQAVELYQEAQTAGLPIDLIIMDLTIPGGMGGEEAVKKIHEINPAVKVIVSSGYSNDPVMADFKKYGFCAALVKPFQMRELIKTIDEII